MIDIERLDKLPKWESRKDYLTRKYGDMWNTRFDHSWMRSSKDQYSYVKAERVIKKFLGKSFDNAFSCYCTKVELREQSDFFDYFDPNSYRHTYTVDDKGNIQIDLNSSLNTWKRKRKKKSIIFESFGYAEGYYDIVSKKTLSLEEIHKKSKESRWGWNENYYRNNNNYTKVVISGFWKEFESVKDPEYKRLMAEKRKALRLHEKAVKKYKRNKEYCFLTTKEKELKDENLQRIRNGFAA